MKFNKSNLRTTDPKGGQPDYSSMLKNRKKQLDDLVNSGIIKEEIKDLPGVVSEIPEESALARHLREDAGKEVESESESDDIDLLELITY